MLRRTSFTSPLASTSGAFFVSTSAIIIAPALAAESRGMKVLKQNWFRNEAVPHARRVSWSPQTTTKKQGAFARMSRSNFYDANPIPITAEPYNELAVEAHRAALQHDVYVYKYSVSPTHLSLRTNKGTNSGKSLEVQ